VDAKKRGGTGHAHWCIAFGDATPKSLPDAIAKVLKVRKSGMIERPHGGETGDRGQGICDECLQHISKSVDLLNRRA
jgi:hypothetical protein